jgi:putative transposase
MDFVADRLEDGRTFRILTVVDQFSPECVALYTKPRLQGSDVAEILDHAIRARCKPTFITVDNGSEFAGKVMDAPKKRRWGVRCQRSTSSRRTGTARAGGR